MTSELKRKKDHVKRNCLFCKIPDRLNKPEKEEDSEEYRKIDLSKEEEKVAYAILDKSPKTIGHTLVISVKPFDDITDSIMNFDEDKIKIFKVVIRLAEQLKNKLSAEKVYLMTMCEHWNMWETDGSTTEHLHFHLVPRYDGMRTKFIAGENLLAKEGISREKNQLKEIADIINAQL